MKKFSFLVIIAFSAVALNGCIGNNNKATISDDQTVSETMSEWQKVGNAIANGESVSCEMTDTKNGISSKYYMKEDKVRFDSIQSEQLEDVAMNGSFLTDGKFGYSWNAETKKGMKFLVNDPEDLSEDVEELESEAPDFSSKEAWDNYENLGYTVTCEIKDVDASLFTPPTDVTFTDLSNFAQEMQQTDGVDQEQLEQMMKQFQEAQ